MKKKIPFDISYREKIESGEAELTTKDDRRVRILKWDVNSDRPIVAVIQANIPDNGEDWVVCYSAEGTRQQGVGPTDLAILVVEEELTEFEEAVRRALLDWIDKWSSDENGFVRKEAAKLLDAARKALRTEFDEELEKAYRNQDDVVYRRGYDAGFEAGSAIDEERLTDRIAEKIAEKIVKDNPFSPVPWTPPKSPYEPPYAPITVMYGVTPAEFGPTADAVSTVDAVSTSASTTNTEDKNGKP